MEMFAIREDELGESRGVEESDEAINVVLELLDQLWRRKEARLLTCMGLLPRRSFLTLVSSWTYLMISFSAVSVTSQPPRFITSHPLSPCSDLPSCDSQRDSSRKKAAMPSSPRRLPVMFSLYTSP